MAYKAFYTRLARRGCATFMRGMCLRLIAGGLIWASVCAAILARVLAHAAQRVGHGPAISTRRVARGKAAFLDETTVDYRLDPATALYLPRGLKRRTHIQVGLRKARRSWVDTTGTFTGCRVSPAGSH